VRESLQDLYRLVREIPGEIEAMPRLHLLSIPSSEGRASKLSFEVFEMLRSAETMADLEASLLSKFEPPTPLTDSERTQLQSLSSKLWRLRELLKIFTPPNRWDRDDISPFDQQQTTKILGADRLLSIDLRGVGARIFEEMFDRIQQQSHARNLTREHLRVIRIDRTVEWLKRSISQSLQSARAELGDRYLTHIWVGDELNLYYRGDSILPALSSWMNPDIRLMDLNLRRTTATQQTESLNVYVQSSLNHFAETASKIIEQHVLSKLESAPRVSVSLAVKPGSNGQILVDFIFSGGLDKNQAEIRQRFAQGFASEMAQRDERIRYWFERSEFRLVFQGQDQVSGQPAGVLSR
jgi:hypothetical protein